MSAEQRLLTAVQVAATFGVTLRTLTNWERVGVLVPVRVRGRRYFALADVDALLAGGRVRYARRDIEIQRDTPDR